MKKTKFDKSVQNIAFKPDTCLNSGEYTALIRDLFSYGFQRKLRAGRTGQMIIFQVC